MPTPPGPTQNQVRAVDPVLTGKLTSRVNGSDTYVADRVFPPIYQEGLKSGTYYQMRTGMRSAGDINIQRAPGTPYEAVGYAPGSASFLTHEYGVRVAVEQPTSSISQLPRDLQDVATGHSQAIVDIKREERFNTAFMLTGVWGTTTTLTDSWNEPAGSPRDNFWTAIEAIELACGKRPDTCVLGMTAFADLVRNGDMTGLIRSSDRRGQLSGEELNEALAVHFGLKRVFVSHAVHNTANVGQPEVPAHIVADSCLLCYAGPGGQGDGAELPGGGHIAATDGGSPTVVDRWYEDGPRTTWVRAREDRDEVVFDAAAGYLYLNCRA